MRQPPPSCPTCKSNVGGIVAGAVVGSVAVAAITVFGWYMIRKRSMSAHSGGNNQYHDGRNQDFHTSRQNTAKSRHELSAAPSKAMES